MKLLFLGYLDALSNEQLEQAIALERSTEVTRTPLRDDPPTIKAEEPYQKPKISRAQRYAWRREQR